MNLEGIQKNLDHHSLGAQPFRETARTNTEVQEYHVRKPKASAKAMRLAEEKKAAEAAAVAERDRHKQARKAEAEPPISIIL